MGKETLQVCSNKCCKREEVLPRYRDLMTWNKDPPVSRSHPLDQKFKHFERNNFKIVKDLKTFNSKLEKF